MHAKMLIKLFLVPTVECFIRVIVMFVFVQVEDCIVYIKKRLLDGYAGHQCMQNEEPKSKYFTEAECPIRKKFILVTN